MDRILSKLKKVELRDFWSHEALDFTRWLGKDENIQLLSDEIGIVLTNTRIEESIGRYNVDLVAIDENTQKKIIIENQLEYTDHKHLGQIITYASGYDASIIIWIVKDIREEHQKAMEWLNNNTGSQLGFFLIKMELWQIDDSALAPKFNVVVEPNDWAKQLQNSQSQPKEYTETKLAQLEFWKRFKDYAKEQGSSLNIGRKPSAQHWFDISIGTSEANLTLTINSKENLITCEFYIKRDQELYLRFEKNKQTIESNIDMQLLWMPLNGKQASRIKAENTADLFEEDNWNSYFEWMLKAAEKMAIEFSKYV
ncbi:DUF4268 domain-containing protein [Aquimarina addita]|uniref:DUF4268 domain-containing protein n=1 Tax=Aquimarina addita TaxID=870485 RepID=A0ABP6UXK7_9FLAO